MNGYRSTQDDSVEVIETYPTDEQYGFAVAKDNTAVLEFLNAGLAGAPRRRHATTSSTPRTSAKLRPDTSRHGADPPPAGPPGCASSPSACPWRWRSSSWSSPPTGPRIQQAFFQPEIAADLFPRIVTVGVKNTLIYHGASPSSAGSSSASPLALMRLSTVQRLPVVRHHLHRAVPRRARRIVTLIARRLRGARSRSTSGCRASTGRQPGARARRRRLHGRDDPSRASRRCPEGRPRRPARSACRRPGRWCRS